VICDLVTLRCGFRVTPQLGRPDHVTAGVKGYHSVLLAGDANGANHIPGDIAVIQQMADDIGTGFDPPLGFLFPPSADIFNELMVCVGFGLNPAIFPAENDAFCALGTAVNSDKQLVCRHG
jgi:hypothetical protein